ncbi:hypothetical protein ABI59_03095 [Acidobacteria bacterium Mor1]|nr:hypothetical protein ABI59_03095 [Acidobacteria bacterium Mor1]
MESSFSSHTLAEVFRDLYRGEQSGVLHLTRGDVEKRLYFDRGMLVYSESPVAEEDLGRRLVHEGKISSGALNEAEAAISESKDLAQTLINRGLIGKEALSHTVQFIVERTVQSVFQWEGGQARFSEGWFAQDIVEGDILSTFESILRGVSRMTDFEPVGEALRGTASRLRLREQLPVPVERLALSRSNGYILSRIDGASTVRDILSLLEPHEEDQAMRFLYGLLVMGVLECEPPVSEGPFKITDLLRDHADSVALETQQEKMIEATYHRIQGLNHYQLLDVTPEATRQEIERAYEDAKRPFSRDRITPKVREKLRSQLAVVESRLVEAFLTLSNSDSSRQSSQEADDEVRGGDLLMRVEADKTAGAKEADEAKKVAEQYYLKGRKFLRDADYYNAIQYGKLAISYCSEDARFYFLLAECQTRNPDARWQRMAEKNFCKATELDPWNPDYWLNLGRFYKHRGLTLRARKQFEEVLKIAPSHEEAVSELKAL